MIILKGQLRQAILQRITNTIYIGAILATHNLRDFAKIKEFVNFKLIAQVGLSIVKMLSCVSKVFRLIDNSYPHKG